MADVKSSAIIFTGKIADISNIKKVLGEYPELYEKIQYTGGTVFKCIHIDNSTQHIDVDKMVDIVTRAIHGDASSIQILIKNSGEKCFSFFQGNHKGEFTRVSRENIIVNMFT